MKNNRLKIMKNFKELNENVLDWAKEKGILDKATPLTQWSKTQEEVDETREALFALQNNLLTYINSKGQEKNTREEVKDGLGDVFVTLLIECKLVNLNPLDCLEEAYNVIAKRTGKMIDGTFVKGDNQTSLLDQEGV